jgi:hypothetical protein
MVRALYGLALPVLGRGQTEELEQLCRDAAAWLIGRGC